jgi:hypothetical protein
VVGRRGALLDGGIRTHNPDSGKWHEIFIDPTSPFNHGIQPRIWGYYHYDYA